MRKDQGNEVDKVVNDWLDKDLPPEVEQGLRGHLAVFRRRLEAREAYASGRPRMVFRVAYVMAALLVITALALITFGSSVPPTWAEVAEQFGTMPFYAATVYVKANAVEEPVQIELWMEQDGRLRLRAGNEVIFGEQGHMAERIQFAPASESVRRVELAEQVVRDVVEKMGQTGAFSLAALVEALSLEGPMSALRPPSANLNASISKDLVVFDITNEPSPDWVRIWALRESRLPVRLLYWDPRCGMSVDVMLSYSGRQPAEFFDPEAFQRALADGADGAATQAYLLLTDPGGRPVTPQDAAEPHETTTRPGQI
ncbi:MAG TPA: hypothetical protein PLO37_22065 [Candidatus Hydrogenedentes bacterium]|nr:hypothetical protein [Candidatus Hydrogenedentota bacterium]HPG69542.1 hypothetical protein [Candidatus Hydrogenedentota bacterium]